MRFTSLFSFSSSLLILRWIRRTQDRILFLHFSCGYQGKWSSLNPFPPSAISCSPSQSHSHVLLCAGAWSCKCAPLYPSPLPRALLGTSLPCRDALQIQPVLDPHARLFLPKATVKSFQYGASHVHKGLVQDSFFSITLILTFKIPEIRIRKKSSVSRNDRAGCVRRRLGGVLGEAACPQWGPTMAVTAFSRRIPSLHNQISGQSPLRFHPDYAQTGAGLCGGCLPLWS